MKELILEAKTDNLDKVIAFLEEQLESMGCSMKLQMQLDVAVEEIFVNIASYAYGSGTGDALIRINHETDPERVVITFIDEGVPYDPLKKEDPDVSLSAEEREIGGLGIFMVKKTMDDMSYEWLDGKNILTLTKNF
ncbi:ATP-binding protein [Butyrivibrio sp. MC2021]|uniref:ATP-binding protein n=1 Tax=Butyrivibrio sp. MC2021 TaxID=1408306 RepID=UPI00047DCF78|nr:ATP-binding protein [Butyrivibrio sp. MC2021]